eukprot:1164129-Prymnesium_polylepis.1
MDAGIDSFDLPQLARKLADATGTWLPVTFLFSFPTVRQLLSHFHGQHRLAATSSIKNSTTDTPQDAPVITLDGFSTMLPMRAASARAFWLATAGGHDLVGE